MVCWTERDQDPAATRLLDVKIDTLILKNDGPSCATRNPLILKKDGQIPICYIVEMKLPFAFCCAPGPCLRIITGEVAARRDVKRQITILPIGADQLDKVVNPMPATSLSAALVAMFTIAPCVLH